MIKNEWKSLWNNKILIIVVMAIIIIPVIYAGLFLKSMWKSGQAASSSSE